MPEPKTYTTEVVLGPTRAAEGNRKALTPEKLNSRVFVSTNTVDPIVRSVYLNRPMSNPYKRAKITVEFID